MTDTARTSSRGRLDPDALAALEEERDFLLKSIRDLDAEFEAGDLDEADHRELKDDYTTRAAEVLRAIDEQRDAFTAAKPTGGRGRLIAAVVAVLVVAIGAGIFVAASSGQRKAGDTVSGGITTTPTASTGEGVDVCITKFRGANPVDGIKCLDTVLQKRPGDAVARTFRGWLLYQVVAGTDQPDLVARAQADLTAAAKAEPNYPIPHFFLAFIANQEGDPATAKAQLDEFDRLGGSAQGMDASVEELRTAIAAAGAGSTTAAPAGPTTVPPAATTTVP